jgi:hypothetical protein
LIKADRLARRALIASRQSAIAAKKAADVAKQNTDAFMSAEKGTSSSKLNKKPLFRTARAGVLLRQMARTPHALHVSCAARFVTRLSHRVGS